MQCSLCALKLPAHPIVAGDKKFCCHGCNVVYQILSVQDALATYQESPVFKEAIQSGLVSNPEFFEQSVKESPGEEVLRLDFEVKDLWCPSCAEVIQLILLRKKGIKSCFVDYATDLARVEYFPKHVSKEGILQRISSLGYTASLFEEEKKRNFSLYLRLLVASFAALNIMMFSYPIYENYFNIDTTHYSKFFAYLSAMLSIPLLVYSAKPIFQRALTYLRAKILGMESLVVIGILSATILSFYNLLTGNEEVYFDSMSMIIVFLLWGKVIESKAKFSAKKAFHTLSRSCPKRAGKVFENETLFVPLKEIEVGDKILVLTGEKSALDGVVLTGEALMDESILTGESKPVLKNPKDKVLAGSIIKNGQITLTVTKKSDASYFQRVIDILQHDLKEKNKEKTLLNHIVSWFVPVILLIAALSFLVTLSLSGSFHDAFVRSLAILLVSCPCAIGIAVPIAEAQMLGALVNLGVIVRNRSVFKFLGKPDVFIFDKTGTLTEGKFKVLSDLRNLLPEERSYLKSIALLSTHPISVAIAELIEDKNTIPLTRFEEIAGRGLKACTKNGSLLLLGSKEHLWSHGIEIKEEGNVYFSIADKLITKIDLGDTLRVDAADAVAQLTVDKKVLLSGDSEQVVAKIAKSCGISEWYSGKDPMQKRAYVEELKGLGKIVAMMGDGINDGPAITSAHMGISLATGTDLSIQVSDILLTTDKLSVLQDMIRIGKKGSKIIKQNLFWAFFYNIIALSLAICGIFPPIIAALAMVLSSFIVLLNAKRI